MNDSLLEKTGASFCRASLRNMCANFEVDRTKRFGTGARQVFATQKSFPFEIPLTMKFATSNSL